MKKAKEKIQRQQEELNRIKTDLLYVSLELEKKKRLLDTFKEKNESYEEMQEELSELLPGAYEKIKPVALLEFGNLKEHSVMRNGRENDRGIIRIVFYRT